MKELLFSTDSGMYRLGPGVVTGRPVVFTVGDIKKVSDEAFLESVQMSILIRDAASLEEAFNLLFAPGQV